MDIGEYWLPRNIFEIIYSAVDNVHIWLFNNNLYLKQLRIKFQMEVLSFTMQKIMLYIYSMHGYRLKIIW